MEVLWFIPTHGDSRYLGTKKGARKTDLSYFRQIAQAADRLGYTGVLIPTGRSCEDPWTLASSLAAVTNNLKFLVAVRPGIMTPTVAARMTATVDRISNGRLFINVVAGGDAVELAGDGIFLPHDDRYELTDEFLTIWRQLLAGKEVNYTGKHLKIEGGQQFFPPVQQPHPPIFFGGSSSAGIAVAAKHADVYLTWGEPPADVERKIKEVRRKAEQEGRTVRFGIRLHVIVRETEEEAWKEAERLIKYVDQATIDAAQKVFARMDSVGQQNMKQLHNGNREALEISPNLWAGIGLVRGGAGTALVGDPNQVAERMKEYASFGIDTFVLSGYPHLEEAYQFAEQVFPLLPLKINKNSLSEANFPVYQPFGEIIANQYVPETAK